MYEWAELRHFRYLLAILEKQGFSAAAEELRTAQPNLSVQARQFQENASIRLFRKMKGGRIRPTDTGIAFKALARILLETRDEVLDALIAIERGDIRSVRFGCTPLVDQGLFRVFCDLHKEILPNCPVRPTHGDTAQLAEEVPDRSTLKGKRDYVILAMLVGCALRRQELASLDLETIQSREGRWVLVDLVGKGGRVRTIAIPFWVRTGIEVWLAEAGIKKGRLLRAVSKGGKVKDSMSDWSVWSVVQQCAEEIGIADFGAHDLRRTCAKLCRKSGGDLEQIKFLLGHSSIQTTERYLGSEQEIAIAVNDSLGL